MKNQPKKDAISKRASDQMDMPEYLRQGNSGKERLGSENVTQADIIVPQLKLCQITSAEGKKNNPEYIEGLEPGLYFNSVTKDVYGDSFRVIPVHFYNRRVRWNEKKLGSGVRCSSEDALIGIGDPGGNCLTCPQSARKYQETDTDRKCNLSMNFPLFVLNGDALDISQLVICSFHSIGCDTGKRWNSLDQFRNRDRFAGVYRLGVREDHRDSGDSFQPTIENDGWATPEQYAVGKLAYHMIVEWRAAGRMKSEDREPGED